MWPTCCLLLTILNSTQAHFLVCHAGLPGKEEEGDWRPPYSVACFVSIQRTLGWNKSVGWIRLMPSAFQMSLMENTACKMTYACNLGGSEGFFETNTQYMYLASCVGVQGRQDTGASTRHTVFYSLLNYNLNGATTWVRG